MSKKEFKNAVWQDKKRTLFGLPISFTRYVLTEEKFLIVRGFWKKTEDEVRLYRIMDVSLSQTIRDRLDRVGTIHVCSSDKTCPEFDIRRVKHARDVKNLLSEMVESERRSRGVTMREEMGGGAWDANHNGVVDIVEK